MGCLFSKCKKKDINQPILKNTIYCHKCKKTYLYNDYHKHIIHCNDFIK